jgi:hypothetical protein
MVYIAHFRIFFRIINKCAIVLKINMEWYKMKTVTPNIKRNINAKVDLFDIRVK